MFPGADATQTAGTDAPPHMRQEIRKMPRSVNRQFLRIVGLCIVVGLSATYLVGERKSTAIYGDEPGWIGASYQTADLLDVSDPNLIWDLYEKLRDSKIFLWTEVIQFSEIYFVKSKSNAAISNVCKPAVERWQKRYEKAQFDSALQKQIEQKVAGKEGEVKKLKDQIVKHQEKIQQLQDQIAKFQKTIDGADAQIDADRKKIESTREGFEHTHQSILNQIEKDIENIKKYL